MAVIEPCILDANVMHHRLSPRINTFHYSLYYMVLPLMRLERGDLDLAVNRFGMHSFYYKDHGYKDGRAPSHWIADVIKQHNLQDIINLDSITLMAFPRVFGFVFNPVSFWLCHDKNGALRAVIYEVNNTFGESHSYVATKDDLSPITDRDILKGAKLFHVSPFLEREGHYQFRIKSDATNFGVWIDLYDTGEQKKLATSLTGKMLPFKKKTLKNFFWRIPFVTVKAILLIHWQAIVLLIKKIKYISKPKQNAKKISQTENNDSLS